MEPGVTANGQLDIDDYMKALPLMGIRTRFGFEKSYITWGFLFVFFGFMSGLFSGRVDFVLMTLGAAFVINGAVIWPLRFKRRMQRKWQPHAALLEQPRHHTITMDGITSLDDLGNPAHFRWNQYVGWAEGPSMFLLFLPLEGSSIFPKRWFDGDDVEVFRQLLECNVEERR